MNNPWNDLNYNSLDYSEHPLYSKIHNQIPVTIKNTEILFAGSCDIGGAKEEKHWYEIYCEHNNLNVDDYTRIGSIGHSMSSLVRRIYAYLKLAEVLPKKILMVAPISMPELCINSTIYPVSKDFDTIRFLERINIIPESILVRLTNLMFASRQTASQEQAVYEFCQNFSFLEMITKAYNIELQWTPNLTKRAVEYYKNLDNFIDNHDFAKTTFIGYDPAVVNMKSTGLDFPSADSHRKIASLFLSNDK